MYLGNGNTPPGGAFSDIPQNLEGLKEKLFSISGKEHSCEVKVSPNCEVRFLAKIALGIGCKLFGDEFANSNEADLLRKFMWTKDSKDREQYPVHGTGFMKVPNENTESLKEFFGWEGGHVLAIVPAFDLIGLHFSIYNSLSASIKMGEFKQEYKAIVGDGICYVIIPGLNRVVGPMKLIEFLSHKLNMGNKNSELLEIENLMKKFKDKPPLDL